MQASEMQRYQIQGCQLRRERFSGRDADFRTGPRIYDGVGILRRHGSDAIRYRGALPWASKLPLRSDRIERLAGLCNKDEQGIRKNHRLAVPILTRIINLDGNASH